VNAGVGAVLIALVGAVAGWIGYGIAYLAIDARDRRRDAERAERNAAHHRQIQDRGRYTTDVEGAPE